MNEKEVSGDRYYASEEPNYFSVNVNKPIKCLHGKDLYLMGRGCISERENIFYWCGKESFSFPSCLPFHTIPWDPVILLASRYPEKYNFMLLYHLDYFTILLCQWSFSSAFLSTNASLSHPLAKKNLGFTYEISCLCTWNFCFFLPVFGA